MTLVIVHLSCESRGRAVQEAELAAWAAEHLKGAWVLGGDFNTVEGEESEALRRALRSAGGRVGANSLPTHFRTQVQVEVEGYTARNLDRIWSSMCGGTWELVDTRGLSDHKMVRLVDIAVPAADDWVLSSFKRRRIGEDVIVRCQKGRLREWVGASQWVKPSCATGWEALVWRVERLRAAGMTSVVVPQIEKMARERGEGVGNPFKTLNEWINEIRTGRLAALAGGAPTRVKTHLVGGEIFRRKPQRWAVSEGGVRTSKVTEVAALTLKWVGQKFAPVPLNCARIEMWAGELRASLSEQDQSVLANARVWPTSILAVEAAINHIGRKPGAGEDGWEGQSIAKMVGGGKRAVVLATAQWLDEALVEGSVAPFTTTLLTVIPKKGVVNGWSDLRPIEVDCWAVRVLSHLITPTLTQVLAAMDSMQFGFIGGRCAVPPVTIVNNLVSTGELVAFLDIEGAYTSVVPSAMRAIANGLGLPSCLQRAIEALTAERSCRYVHNGRVSRARAPMARGLRQGNSASPALFGLYLAVAKHKIGSIIKEKAVIFAFADDLAVWIRNPKDLVEVMEVVENTLAELNLMLNKAKCKIMGDIQLLDSKFMAWHTKEFKYLGIMVPRGSPTQLEKTLASMQTAANIIKARRVPVHIAAQIFNTFIWSRIVYQGIYCKLGEKVLVQVDNIARLLFGIRSHYSKKYLGREIPALCDSCDYGGLNLIDYRGHAECLVGVLARHIGGSLYWPKGFEHVLMAEFESRMQGAIPWVARFVSKGFSVGVPEMSVAMLRKQIPAIRVRRVAEVSWKQAWSAIAQLDPGRLMILWQLVFDCFPCPECWLRHSPVVELNPCRWCGRPVVAGPGHMRACTKFWELVQWDGREMLAAGHISHFLRQATKCGKPVEMLMDAIGLFLKYMNAPATEWDEYRMTGMIPKRKKAEEKADLRTYEVIEAGLSEIKVSQGPAGGVSFSENVIPRFQWREAMEVYTDGSFFPVWKIAAWAVVDLEHNWKMVGPVPGEQTNNRAELMAAIAALAYIAKRGIGKVTIYSDSRYIIDGAGGSHRRLTNLDLWNEFDRKIERTKVAPADFKWTQAHNGSIGNGVADLAARKAATELANARVYRPEEQDYDPALDGWEDQSERQPESETWPIVE